MSRFGTSYPVGRATGVCAATGAELGPGTPCMATLCEREDDEGFERIDYSVEAWDGGARPERLFSFWRTTVPEPTAGKTPFVDDEVLLDLLRRLEGDDRPQRRAFRFVLALVLLRKRVLRFGGRAMQSVDEGASVERWRFTVAGSGDRAAGTEPESLDVVNPRLTDDDVRELTEQLSEILQGEL